jgi:hypothetical protein
MEGYTSDAGVGESWGGDGGGVVQLVVDQLEELIVTLIEEVRARPSVAVAIMAGLAGAVVGIMLASQGRRRRPLARGTARGTRAVGRTGKRAAQGLDSLGDVAELVGLGLRLMENPIVRGYVRAALAAQLRKRFTR